MAASVNVCRATGLENQSEYFGAVTSDERVLHYQVQAGPDGLPDWDHWTCKTLTREQFWAREEAQVPLAKPYPIEQRAFLHLLKTHILPPLPL